MRRVVLLCLMLWLPMASNALQQSDEAQSGPSHYISDDLFIFIHAGPSREYRILGSVEAGRGVNRTDSEPTNDFVEIIDPDGRTGWIEAEYLTDQVSRRIMVTRLRDEMANVQASVAPMRQQVSQMRQSMSEKDAQTNGLREDLAKANDTIAALQAQLDEQNQDEQMQWFIRGGILVAASILFGILLTFLPKRRKRTDEWMN